MPVGKYKTFGECVGAQKKMGKDDLSARKICGTIEKKTQEGLKRQGSSNVKYEDANNRLYIKAFLLDASVNINEWGIAPNSLDKQINTFIGKPLVLTEDFRHPMPPDSQRVGDSDYYDDDEDPTNTVKVDEIVDHWLQYQEAYRVGSIVDITFKNGIYYAIIEVTDEAAKEAFRNNDLPLFVSPAIAQLNPYENASNITNWTGIHLAIVSNPAYTIRKAIIAGQCHENGSENGKCLLQLRQAAIEDKKIPRIGCGFCRTKALQRYASIVREYETSPSIFAQDLESFTNSSFHTSRPHLKTELTDQQTNNNNTTTDTNKPQEFEQKQNEQGGDLGEQNQKGNGTPGKETVTTEKETEEKTTVTKEAAEVGLRVAGMQECINIFQQNGVDPQQAGQICKLAAQALMDNQQNQQQQQPSGGGSRNPQGGPGPSGQFGSVNEFDKLLAKKDLQIEKLSEELKHFKKNDKSDAQRIAELEDQLNNLNLQLKEKELDSYLATKITDVEARTAKVKKFAGLNLSLDDVKEIFEDFTPSTTTTAPPGNTGGQKVAVKKTAGIEDARELEIPSPLAKPAGKVKLQTASTNEGQEETQKSGNEIRERNNRILSSLLQKGGIY